MYVYPHAHTRTDRKLELNFSPRFPDASAKLFTLSTRCYARVHQCTGMNRANLFMSEHNESIRLCC